MTPRRIDAQQRRASAWFESLQDQLCAAFEAIEDDGPGAGALGRFERRAWERPGGGGGTMAILRGRVLEKAGVNVSTVWGEFSEPFRVQIPGAADDPRFWAAGISVVVHPRSPMVPAAHMNTRMIVTTKRWYGGGTDLTPTFPRDDDTAEFHTVLRGACEANPPGDYPRFKAWCDEYFFLPHRASRAVSAASSSMTWRAATTTPISRWCRRSARRSLTSIRGSFGAAWESPGLNTTSARNSSSAAATWSSICCSTAAPASAS